MADDLGGDYENGILVVVLVCVRSNLLEKGNIYKEEL